MEIKELLSKKRSLEEKIEALRIKKFEELLEDYKKGKTTGKEIILEMAEYAEGTSEGRKRMLKTMTIILHKKGLHIPEIEERIRKEFFVPASKALYAGFSTDLSKAGALFEDEAMSKKCMKLQNVIDWVGDEIQLKINRGQLDG